MLKSMKQFNAKGIGLTVSGVMVITLLGKFLGFFKELILAYFFGAGTVSDAYLISQTIPGTLFQVIGTGIATCFVPVYLNIKLTESDKERTEFVNKFISMIMIVCAVIVFVVFMFTEPIVRTFAIGFDADTMQLTVIFTRISVATLFASGFVYTYTSLLQAEKKFFQAAFGVVPYNLGLILAIFLGAKFDIYALSYVSAFAVGIQLLYQIVYVRKIPYHYSSNFKFKDKHIEKALLLFPPIIVGVAAVEINTLIDRTLASSIIIGGVTIVTYGTSLFNMVVGIFSQSIAMVYYPAISEASIQKDKAKLKTAVNKALEMALFFLVPVTFGVIILAHPFVKVLFGHGNFKDNSINLVARVLTFYAIGFVAYAIKQIINNLYYSNQKTKKPMINTIIGIFVNIVGNVLLSKIFGLNGLALSTSLASITIAILLIVSTKKDFGFIPLPKLSVWIRYLTAAGVMGGVVTVVELLLPLDSILALAISVIIGASVYFALTYVMGVNIIKNRRKNL